MPLAKQAFLVNMPPFNGARPFGSEPVSASAFSTSRGESRRSGRHSILQDQDEPLPLGALRENREDGHG